MLFAFEKVVPTESFQLFTEIIPKEIMSIYCVGFSHLLKVLLRIPASFKIECLKECYKSVFLQVKRPFTLGLGENSSQDELS